MRTIIKTVAVCVMLLSTYASAGDSPPPGRDPESDSQASNNTPTPMPKVYKWIDNKGVTHYADQPQSTNDTPINLPTIQVMDSSELLSASPLPDTAVMSNDPSTPTDNIVISNESAPQETTLAYTPTPQ